MNQDLDYMISVMQAAREGKPIQCSLKGEESWTSGKSDGRFGWNWNEFDYRVKPEPVEPRRVMVTTLQNGSHRGGVFMAFDVKSEQERIQSFPESSLVEYIEVTPEVRQKLGL